MVNEITSKGTTIISFGDVVLPQEAYELALNSHVNSGGKPVTVLMTPLSDLQGYFEVQINDDVLINKVSEHRAGYAWTGGVLIAEKEFLTLLSEFNGDINETLKRFKGNVNTALWSGWFVDVSYPWDLLSTIRYLVSDLRETRISKDADVSPRAIIEGPVIIDEGGRQDRSWCNNSRACVYREECIYWQ